MATPEEIAAFRLLIGAPDNVDPYTDEVLSDRIDAAEGDLNGLASSIWREKAAHYSTLVDVSESGSSRKLSDLHKNALAMAASFGGQAAPAASSGVRFSRLTRS